VVSDELHPTCPWPASFPSVPSPSWARARPTTWRGSPWGPWWGPSPWWKP
jgi:hypothetical protein